MITRKIKNRARVSRDLSTMALDQISTGALVCQRNIFDHSDRELFEGSQKDSVRGYLIN